jgi:hypothetical protein
MREIVESSLAREFEECSREMELAIDRSREVEILN